MAGESQCRYCGCFYACALPVCQLTDEEKQERFAQEIEDWNKQK